MDQCRMCSTGSIVAEVDRYECDDADADENQ
jgi:hypothetical protein